MSKAPIVSEHATERGTLRGYITGFAISVYLTLTAFAIVYWQLFTPWMAAFVVAGLATVQFMVQLAYFLHIGKEAKPRWKVMVFYFMLLVVAIIVFGSLWIMSNLDYHHGDHKTPAQQNQYLREQDRL